MRLIKEFKSFAPISRSKANVYDLVILSTDGRIKISSEFATKLGFKLNNSIEPNDVRYLNVISNYEAVLNAISNRDEEVLKGLDELRNANSDLSEAEIQKKFISMNILLTVQVTKPSDFPKGEEPVGKISLANGSFNNAYAYKQVRSILGIKKNAKAKIELKAFEDDGCYYFKLSESKVSYLNSDTEQN